MSALQNMMVARGKDFQDRCHFFMHKAAIAIMSESDQTTNHADRVIYAQKILTGQVDMEEIAISVVTNPTLGTYIETDSNIPDGDLEFVVNSMYDAFAG